MKRRLSLVLAVVLTFGFLSLAAAQQQDPPKSAINRAVQLLQKKGVFTEQEVAVINQAPTPAGQEQRLMEFMLSKGLMTQGEYHQTVAGTELDPLASSSNRALVPVAAHMAADPEPAMAAAPQVPAKPTVIPAVAPLRVLQSDPSKPGGVIPDVKLGTGAGLKFYGFFKSTAAYDSSNPGGQDFPLPGFVNYNAPSSLPSSADTIGNGTPEFHLKARAARFGANFEWPDLAGSNNAITGRLEFDFEGDFTRVLNRNISSIRSSQPSLRLAWMRIDHKVSDKTNIFALFGQDWTAFGSSILPAMLETSGNGISFGSIYTREPQFRLGLWHNFGGSRNFTVGIEPAMVLPAEGNQSTDTGVQLGQSERQGVDSARPGLEGRVVLQFQADKAKGVAPAQIIFSGTHGSRRAIVVPSSVPAAFKSAFPKGASVNSSRSGFTGGFQLPTRYATLVANYYNGEDLRWYFANELFSVFNDPRVGVFTTPAATTLCTAAACAASAPSIDGSTTVLFGYDAAGNPVLVPQHPVRDSGGFAQLSFPLSRIFNANPAGRSAGWTLSFLYGIDEAKARDVRYFNTSGARNKSDMSVANLTYKMNQYVNFAYESSVYRTRSTCNVSAQLPGPDGPVCAGTLFRGLAARSWHDWRNEFGPVFTF